MAAPSPRIAEPLRHQSTYFVTFCRPLPPIGKQRYRQVFVAEKIEKRFDGCVILSTVDLTLFLLKVSTLTKVQSPLGPGLLR